MNTEKHVVYDSQNYFARFLKYEFKKSIEFDSFRKFESFEKKISNYSKILFVIYSDEELVNFMKIYKKGIPIIACTFDVKLFYKMKSIYGILVLDTSKMKSEIIIELKSYLNLTSFSSMFKMKEVLLEKKATTN